MKRDYLKEIQKFHQASSLEHQEINNGEEMDFEFLHSLHVSRKEYKGYKKTPLPLPTLPSMALDDVILTRRSCRNFQQGKLRLDQLSSLLYYAHGKLERPIEIGSKNFTFRTSPSAGALYPLETYLLIQRVEGLKEGIYHYADFEHAITFLKGGNSFKCLSQYASNQTFLVDCNIIILLSFNIQKTLPKYKARSYRYGLLEAGHIGQNIYLVATALGLGVVAIGGFCDEDINSFLGFSFPEECVLYLLGIGLKKS